MREVAIGETQGSRWNSGGRQLVLKAQKMEPSVKKQKEKIIILYILY